MLSKSALYKPVCGSLNFVGADEYKTWEEKAFLCSDGATPEATWKVYDHVQKRAQTLFEGRKGFPDLIDLDMKYFQRTMLKALFEGLPADFEACVTLL